MEISIRLPRKHKKLYGFKKDHIFRYRGKWIVSLEDRDINPNGKWQYIEVRLAKLTEIFLMQKDIILRIARRKIMEWLNMVKLRLRIKK